MLVAVGDYVPWHVSLKTLSPKPLFCSALLGPLGRRAHNPGRSVPYFPLNPKPLALNLYSPLLCSALQDDELTILDVRKLKKIFSKKYPCEVWSSALFALYCVLFAV